MFPFTSSGSGPRGVRRACGLPTPACTGCGGQSVSGETSAQGGVAPDGDGWQQPQEDVTLNAASFLSSSFLAREQGVSFLSRLHGR